MAQQPENTMLDPVFGCWIWLGAVNGKGYGPHWAVYTAATGVKPRPGLVLDHVCRRRRCCRPEHLEPVSQAENQRRVRALHRRALARCPRGHRLTPESTLRTPEDGLVCTVCR